MFPRSIRLSKVPKVLSIHDLIYRKYPDLSPGENLEYIDLQMRKGCQISDHIVSVSESTKRDLIQLFDVAPNKISVIYPVCDARYLRQSVNKTSRKLRRNTMFRIAISYRLVRLPRGETF